MHYYDHYHDPNTHVQLTRLREDEVLWAAARSETRPGVLARVRAFLRWPLPARPANEEVTMPSPARDATRACSPLGHRG
jgi:hypothetical protein